MHIHNIINPALEKAADNGYITRNPAAKVDKKRILKLVPTRVPRPLNAEEVGRYLQNVSHRRLSSLFILDLCTGMRRGELLGLHWADIDHENREIKLERQIQRVQNVDGPGSYLGYTGLKTQKSQRTIKLPLLAYNELMAHKERQGQEKAEAGKGYKDEDLIFCTAIGTKLDPRRVYDIHCQTLVKANIKHIAFHDLRHTVATLLLQAGESTKSIQELLGHSDIRTTLGTYAHVLDEMKAATAEKLDGITSEAYSMVKPDKSLNTTDNNS
ncbi:MAG: site-specific integrase [Syntrophomonadaceae bacterium]